MLNSKIVIIMARGSKINGFIKVEMSEQEVFEGIRKIGVLDSKLDEALLILKGDSKKGVDGLCNKVDRTNGKVKLHHKLLFALYGLVGSLFLVGFSLIISGVF